MYMYSLNFTAYSCYISQSMAAILDFRTFMSQILLGFLVIHYIQ